MKIGYFGDGRWAQRALGAIEQTKGLEICFVVARHEDPDVQLRRKAERLDVPFRTDSEVNDPSFVQWVRSQEVDLNVSMSFDQIIQRELRDAAPRGFINCHAGALPYYRGRSVLNWAIINGEEEFGVTVHYMDGGIDTGDIIEQRFAPITQTDDYASVLDKAVDLCATTLQSALVQLRDGNVDRIPQDEIHPTGFYCSRRREGDEWIDWSWTTERIHNFVRAIAPPAPGARTREGECQLVILESELISDAPTYIDRPGTIVGRDEQGNVVKTGDTTLRITRVGDWENGRTVNNRRPRYPIGTVLGITLRQELCRSRKRIRHLEERLRSLDEL